MRSGRHDVDGVHTPPTDKELRERTEELLRTAESVSLNLRLQTERLAAAISMFDQEVVYPLREGIQPNDRQ